MAVYEHTYRRYTEEVTPQWSRFLVLPRFMFKDIFESKLLVFFYAICFVWPLILGVFIYCYHQAKGMAQVSPDILEFFAVDAGTFSWFLYIQNGSALLLTMIVGPGLMSRDLANNGLPLYLCRPISRLEYVLGKITVLMAMLSTVTWVPGSLLFVLHGKLEGGGWLLDNQRIFGGIVFGSIVWILLLSLLALATSAWVKWRPVAAFVFAMIFLFGLLFALMINGIFHTEWGFLTTHAYLIYIVWSALMGAEVPEAPTVFASCVSLGILGAFSLLLLHLKIRAYEVVR